MYISSLPTPKTRCMSGRCFFDTNVLFYSFHTADVEKTSIALRLVVTRTELHEAVISFQVVQEFFSVAFRKARPSMRGDEATHYLHNVLNRMEIVQSSLNIYEKALHLRERHQLSWYDSLIVAAALEARCETLYTEELNHGQRIEGLTVVNPFR